MRLFSNAVVRTFAPGEPATAAPSWANPPAPSESDSPAVRLAPDSILVDGGTIVAVGTRSELLDIAESTSATSAALASAGGIGATAVTPSARLEEIDCGGQVILPGLVDAHMHSIAYADSLTNLDLSSVSSLAEAVAAIRDRAQSLPVGSWVLGSAWDLNKWEDPRPPDRELLDRAVPDHPVAMWSVDLHTLWVNARALEIAGIDSRTPDPSGGEFVRDHDGRLTGLIREEATELVARFVPEPTRDEQVERLATTQRLFLSQGLTGLHDFDGIASTLAWNDLREADRQHMRVMKYLRGVEVPWAIETGWRTGDGDAWLRRGGLKLFSDGALGSHSCHMSVPFPDPVPAGATAAAGSAVGVAAAASGSTPAVPGDAGEVQANYGIAQMTEGELFEQARMATEAGISVAIHAIGDQANHHVLNVFERLRPITKTVEEKFRRPLRHRVEHAQFIQPADVARFRELGVIASMQPRHCISDLHLLHLIDESAQLAAYAWPDLIDAGVEVAFGSDGPVEPANPFAAIYAAMTRANIGGDPRTSFQPQRRLSAAEAIRLHTQGPAYTAGLEDRRGHLAPGMDADFIIVDTDPCTADGLRDGGTVKRAPTTSAEVTAARDGLLGYSSEEALFAHASAIRDTRVAMTVVGGEVKHSV
ncbi:amidohydrolase family protein [Brevibacterium sp.]|uniref:amidohydrolase n=1 Tax=Brevibacterium sp. TaxID=1701 RepID=UPI002811D688|nr:amidohydrolase family protein [Brevibacterium sp.]